MKKFLPLLLLFMFTSFTSSALAIEINAENFPDENFRQFLLTERDIDGDDDLSQSEIAAINELRNLKPSGNRILHRTLIP